MTVQAKTFRGFGTMPAAYYARSAARTVAKECRLAASRRPAQVLAPVVILFSRRSGSTWLIELLRGLRGVATVQDPLLERNVHFQNLFYRLPLRHYYFAPDQIAACAPLLRDALGLRRATSLDLPLPAGGTVTPIMKIANAPWTDAFWRDAFGAQVFRLIRHPVPTARSQLRYSQMRLHLPNSVEVPEVRERLTPDQMRLCRDAITAGDELRVRICELFVENLPAFGPTPTPTPLIHYEDLVARDFTALDFAGRIDPDWRAVMEARFDRPSATVTEGRVTSREKGGQHLTPDEAAFLRDCIAAFGAERVGARWLPA